MFIRIIGVEDVITCHFTNRDAICDLARHYHKITRLDYVRELVKLRRKVP